MGHCCPQLLLSSVTGGVVEDRDRSPTHRLVLLLKEKCQPRWRSWREAWSGQRSFAEALLSLASLVGTWECACVCSSGGRRHTLTHLCLALSSAFVRLFWRPLQADTHQLLPLRGTEQGSCSMLTLDVFLRRKASSGKWHTPGWICSLQEEQLHPTTQDVL